jgi:predicted PurR-regulated permease PerM
MSFPPPTEGQARVLWFSLTTLAVGVVVGLLGLLAMGLGIVVSKLSTVIFPLAVAGIGAYLLEPIVAFVVRHRVSRLKAIILVFALVTFCGLGLLATVVPRLVVEGREFAKRTPEYAQKLTERATNWMAQSTLVQNLVKQNAATDVNSAETTEVLSCLGKVLPTVRDWFLTQAQRVASWFGLFLGMLLTPVYLFYLLMERDAIERGWRGCLPVRNERLKGEIAFIIASINDSLIVFFRGQVLVSLCSGVLLTIAFMILGLNYAIFLGALAGILGIIPYLGAAISLIPALTLAAVQFQDWWHPVLVLACYGLVNLIESFVTSPKIIGDRVGLHPLVIMVAMMVGTTLMGGVLGGLLAIPLTAALRTIVTRYLYAPKSS